LTLQSGAVSSVVMMGGPNQCYLKLVG